ncbi:MAG TPA: DUF2298 domain-containing protein [Chloroflexota bacterium]|nr:DUF2298 domain-containing protein [Chloroflexota bacterium]
MQPARRRAPSWTLKAARPYLAAGLLAVYLFLVGGNLWTALRRIDGSGLWEKDFWQGIGWNATRVLVIKGGPGGADVDYTINEFPSFSFLLGDLHPHVLALPFALLAVGVAYGWLRQPPLLHTWAAPLSPTPQPTHEGPPALRGVWWSAIAGVVPGCLVLGSLYFLNSWDFPAYFALAQAGALAGAWCEARRSRPAAGEGAGEHEGWSWSWGRAAGAVVVCGALAMGAVLPFTLSFRPPVVGGGGLPLGLVEQRSLLEQFVQFWGAQLLLLVPATLTALVALDAPRWVRGLRGTGVPAREGSAWATGIVAHGGGAPGMPGMPGTVGMPAWAAGREPALLLIGSVVLVLLAEHFQAGTLTLALLLAGATGWAAWQLLGTVPSPQSPVPSRPPARNSEPGAGNPSRSEAGRALAFAFGVICLAALLLAACEVVYIRDFYGGPLRRMNTVFKLYYQAWLLFAIGGSVATFWLLRRLWRRRTLPGGRAAWGGLGGLCAVVLLAMAMFPYRATMLRTNELRNQPTLHGMEWLRRAQPDDYAAAEWLRLNGAREGVRAPVVLEATGGAYSEFARVATQTGFPTVLGWDQHERLWRGAAIEAEVAARQRDVEAIYSAATIGEARPLLDKYGVAYVVVGYLERQKYGPSGGLAKFNDAPASGLSAVFRQGTTAIYRIERAMPPGQG